MYNLFLLIGYLLGFILACKIFELKYKDLERQIQDLRLSIIEDKINNYLDED